MTADRDPRDVEARLRASLCAYADVVGDDPGRPVGARPGGRQRSSPGRRWRVPALVAAAVLAGTGGVLFVSDPPSAPGSVAAPGSTAAERSAEAVSGAQSSAGNGAQAAAAAPGDAWAVPPPAEVGVEYPLDLYTHCGVRGADVGGVWFAADPPLVGPGGDPPAGWGDPYQRGTLTLRTQDEAVFRDDLAHEVEVRAAPESERPPPCD